VDINCYTSIDKLVLVYQDSDGQLHRQPGRDLPQVGTLIDPDTEEDMPLVGFILAD